MREIERASASPVAAARHSAATAAATHWLPVKGEVIFTEAPRAARRLLPVSRPSAA